ncbi:MAG: hypothetical protein ACI9WR_001745 [Paracoccaceae bacterium]|jgi:hypothetical protein
MMPSEPEALAMGIITSIATLPISQTSPEQHHEFNQVNNRV